MTKKDIVLIYVWSAILIISVAGVIASNINPNLGKQNHQLEQKYE